MRAIELLILVLCLALCQCRAKNDKRGRQLPSFVHICSKSDPILSDCLRKSIQILQPRLAEGIPEMLIPPLDPLNLPYVSLRENSLDASFEDLRIHNLNKNNLTHINISLENNEIRLKQFIPVLRIECTYKIVGKILILQLRGSGAFEGNFSNVTADVHMYGDRITRGGKKYLRLDKAKVRITMEEAHLRLDGLFADEKLNESTNEIINANIKDFLLELMPLIEATVENFVVQMTSKFFATFDLDTLFSP